MTFWLSLPVHSGSQKKIDYPKLICLTHPLLDVFTALKGTHFYIFFFYLYIYFILIRLGAVSLLQRLLTINSKLTSNAQVYIRVRVNTF